MRFDMLCYVSHNYVCYILLDIVLVKNQV